MCRWATSEQLIIYTSNRLIGEIGQYYYRHRFYHAQLGRFCSRDPIGYKGGSNLSLYLGSQPTVARDPFGRNGDHHVAQGDMPERFSVSGALGIIQGIMQIDASMLENPPLPGFVTPGEILEGVIDKRYIGAQLHLWDTQKRNRCGPDNSGIRVWASARRISEHVVRSYDDDDETFVDQVQKDVTRYWTWDKPSQEVTTRDFFDFAGFAHVDWSHTQEMQVASYAVAILCRCANVPSDYLSVIDVVLYTLQIHKFYEWTPRPERSQRMDRQCC